MRAVEHRRVLVRASTSGPSAIVDRVGRVIARSEPSSRAVLAGEIAASREVTAYTRWGDAFAWSCLVVLAVALVVWSRTGH